MVKETRNIRRQVLPNGLTVITEQMPHIRSVAIGIWLKSGTRDTVKKFERPVVSRFYGHHFAPGNLIVSAAGNLDHNHFVELVGKHFEHVKPAKNGLHSPQPKIFSRINL